MNDNGVVREVVDRLRAIGVLGDRVKEGRIDVDLALSTAIDLLVVAQHHANHRKDP